MAVGRDTFLKEALASIYAQIMPSWELILFNNKGIDIKTKDRRIKIFETYDMPPPVCYNEGIKYAKSDHIMIATDDDINFPERSLITHYYLSSGYDYVAGSCIEMKGQQECFKYVRLRPFRIEYQKYIANTISLPFAGFNRRRIPHFNENYKFCYDYLFNLECGMKKLKIKTTFTPLGLKRVWKNSLYNSASKEEIEGELNKIRELHHDSNIRIPNEDIMRKFMGE